MNAVVIAAGEESDVIGKIFNGKKVGTLFLPEKTSSSSAITATMNELNISNNDSNNFSTSSSSSSSTTTTTTNKAEVDNSNNNSGMTAESIEALASTVRSNSRILQSLSSLERTNILLKIVEYLHDRQDIILEANAKDMEKAEKRFE